MLQLPGTHVRYFRVVDSNEDVMDALVRRDAQERWWCRCAARPSCSARSRRTTG